MEASTPNIIHLHPSLMMIIIIIIQTAWNEKMYNCGNYPSLTLHMWPSMWIQAQYKMSSCSPLQQWLRWSLVCFLFSSFKNNNYKISTLFLISSWRWLFELFMQVVLINLEWYLLQLFALIKRWNQEDIQFVFLFNFKLRVFINNYQNASLFSLCFMSSGIW